MADVGLFEAGLILGITLSAIGASKLAGLGINLFQNRANGGVKKNGNNETSLEILKEQKRVVYQIRNSQKLWNTQFDSCLKGLTEEQKESNTYLRDIKEELIRLNSR